METTELVGCVIEDVESAGSVVGRLATFPDGHVRAFWRDPLPPRPGSTTSVLVFLGVYRTEAAARAAIMQHEGR